MKIESKNLTILAGGCLATCFLLACDNTQFGGQAHVDAPLESAVDSDPGARKDNPDDDRIFFPHNVSGSYLFCRQLEKYDEQNSSGDIACRISQDEEGAKDRRPDFEAIEWSASLVDLMPSELRIEKRPIEADWHISLRVFAESFEEWTARLELIELHALHQNLESSTPLRTAIMRDMVSNKTNPHQVFDLYLTSEANHIGLHWQAPAGLHILILRWSGLESSTARPESGRAYQMGASLGNTSLIYRGPANQWLDDTPALSSSYSYQFFAFVPGLYDYQELGYLSLARNCLELARRIPGLRSGVQFIYPEGFGRSFDPVPAYCDMETDNGGWTMVLNYLRRQGTVPELSVRTSDLPLLQASAQLGMDGSEAEQYWGHAGNQMMNQLSYSEIRFYCTADHGRTIHFKTSSESCRDYFKNGIGQCGDISSSRVDFADHSALMLLQDFSSNRGQFAMTMEPFFQGNFAHWNLNATFDNDPITNRWECDDGWTDLNTKHHIWVR